MFVFNEEGYIDSDVQDVLYELGNVGLGMVSITVGKIMGVRMHIGVPTVEQVNEELLFKLCKMEKCVSFQQNFEKTISGSMLFIMRESFLDSVVKKMCENEDSDVDEADRESVLQEFSNLICAAYLKAIGSYTGLRLYVKPSNINIHKNENVAKREYRRLMEKCNKAISVDTSFDIVTEDGEVTKDVGHVIMLPDELSVMKLVEPLCD